MADASTYAVVYIVKLARAMMLWIALFFAEKVYQDTYVTAVYLNSDPPPSLLPIVPMTIAIELVGLSLIFLSLVLLMKWFKSPSNTFIVDQRMLRLLFVDYVISLMMLLGVGMTFAYVVQSGAMLRYHEDGLRGIRALCGLLLPLFGVVIGIPFFALV
jgi:hypothetical protein